MADSGSLFDTFPVSTRVLSSESKYLNAAKAMIYEELLSCSTNNAEEPIVVWAGGKRGRSEVVSSTTTTAAEEGEEATTINSISGGGVVAASGVVVEDDELHPEYLRSHRIHREVFEEASQIVIPEMWNGEWDLWRRTRRERTRLVRALQDKEAALAALQSKNKQHY